jgi:hypothetical protein
MLMSTRRTTSAVVAVLFLGVVVFLAVQTRALDVQLGASNEAQDHLRAAVDSSNKERDALLRQVQTLNRRIDELERRDAVARPPAAEASGSVFAKPTVAAQVAEAPKAAPAPRVSTVAPAGWAKNGSAPGSYAVGVDQTEPHEGAPSAYVKSTAPSVDGFGGMMQQTSADDFVGKRVRYSAWVKTRDANDGGGHLWLRIDGNDGSMLGFDNMDGRPVQGTTDWQRCAVVLDVPPGAAALAYGFFVAGTGQMWVSGATLEVVGPDVASTDLRHRPPATP